MLASGCAGDLSALDPAGPAATDLAALFWAMFAVAAGFTILLAALFVIAVQRRSRAAPNAATHPRSSSPQFWTHWLGIAMPLAVLTILLAATIIVGERQFVRNPSLPIIRATAAQWGWQFAAVAADGSKGPATSQLQLVAGQPTIIELVSEDVIHSFWVPRLAGKMDAVPGKMNRHLIEADAPGQYLGQCAEYCGVGHDFMRFDVTVVGVEGEE